MEKLHKNCHQGRQIKDGMLEDRKKFCFFIQLYITHSGKRYGVRPTAADCRTVISRQTAETSLRSSSAFRLFYWFHSRTYLFTSRPMAL